MPGEVEWVVSSPDEITDVRHALQAWLAARGCARIDDALLVLSELVTNAVAHGGGSAVVCAVHQGDVTRLEVRDGTSAAPVVRPESGSNGGFGLRIVDRLSTSWGWRASGAGKVVWAVVPCHPSPLSDHGVEGAQT